MKDCSEEDVVLIDCDACVMRGPGCRDCVVSVVLGLPPEPKVDKDTPWSQLRRN